MQEVASRLTEEFNKVTPKGTQHLEYLEMHLFNHGNNKNRYMTVEPLLNARSFVKWSNNLGSTNTEDYETVLDAFSHFTYEFTNGFLIVVDLQGEKKNGNFHLTDPAIHCIKGSMFGETNLQLRGIVAFFQSRECNDICRNMQLTEIKMD